MPRRKKLQTEVFTPEIGVFCVESDDGTPMKFFKSNERALADDYAELHKPARVLRYVGWETICEFRDYEKEAAEAKNNHEEYKATLLLNKAHEEKKAKEANAGAKEGS